MDHHPSRNRVQVTISLASSRDSVRVLEALQLLQLEQPWTFSHEAAPDPITWGPSSRYPHEQQQYQHHPHHHDRREYEPLPPIYHSPQPPPAQEGTKRVQHAKEWYDNSQEMDGSFNQSSFAMIYPPFHQPSPKVEPRIISPPPLQPPSAPSSRESSTGRNSEFFTPIEKQRSNSPPVPALRSNEVKEISEQGGNGENFTCAACRRTFSKSESRDRHQKICPTVFLSKRQTYDSQLRRQRKLAEMNHVPLHYIRDEGGI